MPVSEPKVLLSEERVRQQPSFAHTAWRVLIVPAVLFTVVGGVDSALTWYPTDFGRAEWEFGTVTASLNGLPLPVLGLVLLMAAMMSKDSARGARAVAVVLAILGFLIVAMGLLYLLTLPQALQAAETAGGLSSLGLKKAMVKTAVQLIAYPAGLFATAWIGWRYTRRSA